MGVRKDTRNLWATKNFRGDLLPWTCSYTRAGSKERVMSMFSAAQTWKHLYRNGWRQVRVRVTAIKGLT